MLSNQSVSGQPSPAPTAQGVLPEPLILLVSASSPCQSVGGSSVSLAGSYQTVLFEFALATIP
jgi:hypothetical protein